ncbi:hypothetical protein F0Q45_24230 [Mycobacterium simiae]|uniref:Uncharacterized protein n=1 Tax=Mycobacterium simiae TaxID=1784 RepID=A0A5B1BBY2_MYCSI|nr:hypothetical protein [Mycobacterium simiae]KAA1245375.1 hypothetical protein F0Q45_24230 [Mycobacterium simiae]
MPTRSTLPVCFAASFFGCVILLLSGFTAFNLLLYREHTAELSILLYRRVVEEDMHDGEGGRALSAASPTW